MIPFTATVVLRVMIAFFLGGLIGYEREKKGQAAGLRTHILVCIGAALTTMTGVDVSNLGFTADPLRLGAQVVSGIGFLGAGAIIVTGKNNVHGLTTAAGLWVTATIGLAVGLGFYAGGIFCALIASMAIALLNQIEAVGAVRRGVLYVYLEINGLQATNDVLSQLEQCGEKIRSMDIRPAKSAEAGNIGVEISFYVGETEVEKRKEILSRIRGIEHIVLAVEVK